MKTLWLAIAVVGIIGAATGCKDDPDPYFLQDFGTPSFDLTASTNDMAVTGDLAAPGDLSVAPGDMSIDPNADMTDTQPGDMAGTQAGDMTDTSDMLPACNSNPMTNVEIINACSNADTFDVDPFYPTLAPGGVLPPLQ